MLKINYVIATWSGKRRVFNENYLKHHLIKLSTLKHNLSQITIVKPIFEGYNNKYYDFKDIVNEIKCEVVVLNRYNNIGESYGQLFYAYETYKEKFDYYIFCEDDYLPHIDNFDLKLLNFKNDEGYLCSYCGIGFDGISKSGGCSISNGLISTNNFKKIYNIYKNPISEINGANGGECHKNFANLLNRCGLTFKDFASEFSVPYFGNNIIEYGNKNVKKTIFAPHQLLDFKITFVKMELEDLPFFLNIRNKSLNFLHNDTKFSVEDSIKWFNDTNPIFYIIKLESKYIGYFRTSNWDLENKTLYLGCDIHPNYRGFGISQIAYKKFIVFLTSNFNIKNIKLEVLSNNYRAIHIYSKLGFIKIGYGNKQIRDGKEVESILMELVV